MCLHGVGKEDFTACIKKISKVKAVKAQRGSRGIALLFS